MKYKIRKPAILTALLFTVATGIALAQQYSGPGANRQGSPGMRLAEELTLDEAQAAEVQAIMEEARALHKEIRAQARAQGKTVRDETNTAIMAVLNADQQARFGELLQLRAERWGDGGPGGQRRGGRRGPSGGDDGECPNPECPNPDCPDDDG
jgi:Spy/CpxP family protein refolding chaperone